MLVLLPARQDLQNSNTLSAARERFGELRFDIRAQSGFPFLGEIRALPGDDDVVMAGPALDRVFQRLSGIKSIANGWVARCPAHDDKVQSLQVSERDDLSVGLHCHAGCDKFSIIGAMGLTFGELYSETTQKHIVKCYDYRSLDGELLFQSVRYYPKEFRQRRPDPTKHHHDPQKSDDWIWNLTGLKTKKVPYRLPELKGMNEVWIVEGEKDADRLWNLGLPATCNAGGAKKWSSVETKALKAAGVTRLYILPDNDEAGYLHADIVASSAKQFSLAYSIHELPDLSPKGDVSDWLMNGGSKDMLVSLVKSKLVLVVPEMPVPEVEPVPENPLALADPLAYKQTQTGAAEAFRDRYKALIRYDHSREEWFVWEGHRWCPDATDHVTLLSLQHSRLWAHEVIDATVEKFNVRKEWQDFTRKLERRSEQVAMVQTARAFPELKVGSNAWDQDPWLLGTPNGVVDLRTGVLRDGLATDGVSQQVGVPYDAEATCPRWKTFLDEVFDGDLLLIDFVHRALGYSLTGDISEQCFFMALGSGSNGKSLFLSTLQGVWGSYARRANMNLFIGDVSRYDMADVVGRRMVLAAESKPDIRLNEDIVKALTGGESQNAERKFGHPFQFDPICKIWLATNAPPKVIDDSYGFWRRVRLLPFLRTFSGSTDDKHLRDTLRAEMSGILTWVVEGAQQWRQRGLDPPAVVTDATDEYQNAEDPLVEFISDRCTLDPDGIETFTALFAAYGGWAEKVKIPRADRLTRRMMGTHLKRRFATKDLDGSRRYGGIRIKKTASDNLYGESDE